MEEFRYIIDRLYNRTWRQTISMVIQYSLWNATSRLIATNSPTLPRKTCKILKITGFNINTEITVITLKNIEPTACRLE